MKKNLLTSAHGISAAAIPAQQHGGGQDNGHGAKGLRQSHLGAQIASLHAEQQGWIEPSVDACKVNPLQPGEDSDLWTWVQPVMSAGGHIIGKPVRNTMSPDDAETMGLKVLAGIENGAMYEANRPEYAIPVLWALISIVEKSNPDKSAKFRNELLPFLAYSAEPKLDSSFGISQFDESSFLDGLKNRQVAEHLRCNYNLSDILNGAEVPNWKEIKASFAHSPPGQQPCSNSLARYTRRLLTRVWPSKHEIQRWSNIRREFLRPLPSGYGQLNGGDHPVQIFLHSCWRMRPSSISCQLNREPPSLVDALLKETIVGQTKSARNRNGPHNNTDEDDEYDNHPSYSDMSSMRIDLVRKFQLFRAWVDGKHGRCSSPVVWSDTLSRFARSINYPQIDWYNQQVGAMDLMNATSFVPRDLAPEMYHQGHVATGYFFMGQGLYYAYSAAWRCNAVAAYTQNRIPVREQRTDWVYSNDDFANLPRLSVSGETLLQHGVTPELAMAGGSELLAALHKAGVSEYEFTEFLRSYYFNGIFLDVNLGPPAPSVENGTWMLVV